MSGPAHYTVSGIDENHLLYGNFIGLQYVFKQGLDAKVLTQAIEILGSQFPALSGRYSAKQGQVVGAGLPLALKVQRGIGSVNDILGSLNRPQYVIEPKRKDVLRGHAPLSSFTLTEFESGGAILGVAISHLLTDAAGFHLLMRHLGSLYSSLQSGGNPHAFPFTTQLGAFEFGTPRSKADTLSYLKERKLPKPIPIKGLMGNLIKTLIIKAMDKSISENAPIALHFSPDDITRLKQTVLSESGEVWISTNAALCAHFTSIMAKLSYGDDIKTEMQIGQLLDLRGRYFEAESNAQSTFVGNAILIHIDKAAFPDGLQNTSRGVLARYFKQRQADTTADDVKDRLDLLADCLRHGYTNPELDVKNPIISLNNQSKMPVYDISFGGQRPARIYPQDVGDNIMFFPAPDGGIDIYIRDIVNPGGQEKLLSPEWQKHVFDF